MTSTTSFVLLLAACLLGQIFFVSAELSLTNCDRQRLRRRVTEGSRSARAIERMIAAPRVTLSTTLIGANAAGLIAVLVSAIHFAAIGIHPWWSIPYVVPGLVVFGQLVPRAVMQVHADRVVDFLAPPLRLASWILRPLVWIVSGFTGAVTRLSGLDRRDGFVSRDELARLMDSEPTTDKPQISVDEREMIARVFELSGLSLRDVMVPLSEVTALSEDTTMREAAREIADKQHSRVPIYRGRVDDIIGIVHVFDVLGGASEPTKQLADEVRPVSYVPETMKAIDLLVELQAEGQHLAIVVDEYGGAVGVVTTEDLLETIVGAIDDEYDDEPSPIAELKPNEWRVEARTSVVKLNQELDLDLPESDDYETIAGLMIERFRHIPESGEQLTIGSTTLEVIAASDRAIEAVRIVRKRK